ncbi:MAG: hypothetical protein GXO89_18165 [Chlorobi bacterium]|nr:hypothetical protein [Chlorobiota bacterium]
MKYGKIFWGVILVTLGILFAFRNFGVIDFSAHEVFRLWPLLLVFWGIAIIPLKPMVKLVLTVITIVIGIIFILNSPVREYHWFNWYRGHDYTQNNESERIEQHFAEAFDTGVVYAKLNLEVAAGDFKVGNTCVDLFEFYNEGNSVSYDVNTQREGKKTTIDIKNKGIRIGNNRSHEESILSLNEQPVWDLDIDVGASDMKMDLRPFKVENIEINGGAAAIDLKVGDRVKEMNISVDAGASSIKIRIPKSSDCEVKFKTILSSQELDGFIKIKKGLYQTPNFSSTSNKVYIEVDAAITNLKVSRY